jgi:hypothetical protein
MTTALGRPVEPDVIMINASSSSSMGSNGSEPMELQPMPALSSAEKVTISTASSPTLAALVSVSVSRDKMKETGDGCPAPSCGGVVITSLASCRVLALATITIGSTS